MEHGHKHKWAVLAAVTLASFITSVDSTIVLIGLPKLMQGLNASIVMGLWFTAAYVITGTVFLLPAGRWSDMVGKKKIFISGISIFTIATIFCGIATSGTMLIVFRFLQGIGAAFAQATATPIIMKTFPKDELGLAVGINSTSWVLGAIIGPVAGGALIDLFSWRLIFFVTVPVALIAIIAAVLVLKSDDNLVKSKTDWAGIGTFGVGLTLFLIALSNGQSLGWSSFSVILMFLLTIVCLVAFILIERKVESPLFNFQLLKHGHYSMGLILTTTYCIGYFAITFLLTIYLQGALHLNALDAGMLLIPLSAPQVILGGFGGKLADRFGALRALIIGQVVIAIGMFLLGGLGTQLKVAGLIIPLIMISCANSLGWPALVKTVLSQAPSEQSGVASSMFYTVYNAGRALSQTLVLLAVELRISPTIVTQALAGTPNERDTIILQKLAQATGMGFRIFTSFFILTIILAISLVFSHKGRIKTRTC